MKRYIRIILTVLLSPFVLQCCSESSDNLAGEKLTKEAMNIAKKQFDKLIVHCGDYWYLKRSLLAWNTEYYKIKDEMKFEVDKEIIHETDKSKGLQWRGFIRYKIGHVYQKGTINKSNKWHNWWSPWEDESLELCLKLSKEKGEWRKIEGAGCITYSELSCQEIERLNSSAVPKETASRVDSMVLLDHVEALWDY